MYEARVPKPPRRQGTATLVLGLLALALPIAIAVVLVIVLSGGGGRSAGPAATPGGSSRGLVESIFQDDDRLVYAPSPTVIATLDQLAALGVDRVRVTVLWKAIAPDPTATSAPAGFRASDPAAYGIGAWTPYDRLVELASRHGIGVDFNVTAPGPLWAMGGPAPSAHLAAQFRPDPAAFGQFVTALGTRYSGSYSAVALGATKPSKLPRVDFWSIWNEPNQPGWLAPQWGTFSGAPAATSPALYRSLLDVAFAALQRTGHGPSRDTVLIGELASEGSADQLPQSPIPPIEFVHALYCVDDSYRPLSGQAAVAVGCPLVGGRAGFVSAHPGLFQSTGFAHHPYSLFLAPAAPLANPEFVPLSELSRLERALDALFIAYGVPRHVPIYITEYGYETNPPDPYRGVAPRDQSRYLNEAEYLAWKDPRVRSMAQFLLVDAGPDTTKKPGSIPYWATFQSGLEYADGSPKLSLNSYRLPIFIPDPATAPGHELLVWGMLRAARNATVQRAQVQWRPLGGTYRTLATVTTSDPSGFLTARVTLPGAGAIRIAWRLPGEGELHSRAVGVT